MIDREDLWIRSVRPDRHGYRDDMHEGEFDHALDFVEAGIAIGLGYFTFLQAMIQTYDARTCEEPYCKASNSSYCWYHR